MKFIVSASVLLENLQNINGVVSTNPFIPILEHFLLKVDSDLHVAYTPKNLGTIKEVSEISIKLVEGTIKVFRQVDVDEIYSDTSFKPSKLDNTDRLLINIYKDSNNLLFIDDFDLELVSQRLFEGLDYQVEPTPRTRDGGFDMKISKQHPIPITHLVECKSSKKNKSIGITHARALYGVINEHNACSGILITNTRFTSVVIKFTKKLMAKIVLINGQKLLEFIRQHVERFLWPQLSVA